MPKRAIYPIRNHPNTLATLCQRYGDIVLGAIAKGKMGIRQDSLKVRLINLYAKEGIESVREREKVEFQGHNLQSLKYDATRLFIRIAAQEIAWRNKDICALLGEIAWSIDNNAYSAALEIGFAARHLAIEKEEFRYALLILEMEREALIRLEGLGSVCELNKENLELTHLYTSVTTQITQIQSIKQRYFDPIKVCWDKNEIVPKGLLNDLEREVVTIGQEKLLSITAKVEFLSIAIPLSLHSNKIHDAGNLVNLLLELYNGASWIISKHPTRYLAHLRAFCLFFIEQGQFEKAQELLSKFRDPSFESSGFSIEMKYSWIRCAVFLALVSKNDDLRLQALSEFEAVGSDFWDHVGEKSTIVVQWVSMLNYIEINGWRKANSIGLRILMLKSKMKVDILVNVRIAIFVCEICLFKDDFQRIESSYSAIQKFIFRNRKDFPRAGKILKTFYRLWVEYSRGTIGTNTYKKITDDLGGNHFASESRNSGYFDFQGLMLKVFSEIKTHQ